MSRYVTTIPFGRKDITLGMPFGQVILRDGDIVYDSFIVAQYPQYFKKIPDNFNTETKVLEPAPAPVQTEETQPTHEQVTQKVEQPKAPVDEKVEPPKITGAKKDGKPKKKNLFQRG